MMDSICKAQFQALHDLAKEHDCDLTRETAGFGLVEASLTAINRSAEIVKLINLCVARGRGL